MLARRKGWCSIADGDKVRLSPRLDGTSADLICAAYRVMRDEEGRPRRGRPLSEAAVLLSSRLGIRVSVPDVADALDREARMLLARSSIVVRQESFRVERERPWSDDGNGSW